MSGLAELRNDLRNEVRYGLRYLVRDSAVGDRKSTRLNSSHSQISYAVFCLKKKKLVPALYRVLPRGVVVGSPVAPLRRSPPEEVDPSRPEPKDRKAMPAPGVGGDRRHNRQT